MYHHGQNLKKKKRNDIFSVYHKQTVNNPKKETQGIAEALGVEFGAGGSLRVQSQPWLHEEILSQKEKQSFKKGWNA